MRLWIAVALVAAALPAAARAEPKTITIDGCAKVETEIRKDADRSTITVRCTGEAFDPKVREATVGSISTTHGSTVLMPGACIRGDGTVRPC